MFSRKPSVHEVECPHCHARQTESHRRHLHQLPLLRPVFQAAATQGHRGPPRRARAEGHARGRLRHLRLDEPRALRRALHPVHALQPLPRARQQGGQGRADRQDSRLRRRPLRRGLLVQGHGSHRPPPRGARQSLQQAARDGGNRRHGRLGHLRRVARAARAHRARLRRQGPGARVRQVAGQRRRGNQRASRRGRNCPQRRRKLLRPA